MNYTIDKNDPKWKDELEAFINCIQSDHISILSMLYLFTIQYLLLLFNIKKSLNTFIESIIRSISYVLPINYFTLKNGVVLHYGKHI